MTEAGRDYLKEFFPLYSRYFPGRPLVIVTKSRLTPLTVALLESAEHPLLLFLSQSFNCSSGTRRERGPVADFEDTLHNFDLLTKAQNITAMHFWRPFLVKWNSSSSLHGRMARLKAAGSLCSVAIGLKVGSGVSLSSIAADVSDAESSTSSGDEIISSRLWQDLSDCADNLGYVVYRNTSCAIALAGQAREQLGTYEGVLSKERCQETSCPPHQRRRCFDRVGKSHPIEDGIVNTLLTALKVTGPWAWSTPSDGEPALELFCEVPEFAYNTLCHRLGVKVHAARITQEKAWLGAFTGRPSDG
jgi:hypothetical protein